MPNPFQISSHFQFNMLDIGYRIHNILDMQHYLIHRESDIINFSFETVQKYRSNVKASNGEQRNRHFF